MQEQPIQPSINPGDLSWPFWFTVPIYPYGKRRTIREEVVKDTIWTFEQLQGIFYVVVPIRMTIVKLQGGGLLVYAPVAPTRECIRLVKEIVAEHGDIKYIILPTISGVEHKVFVGPFARCFPKAEVFVAPNQWSYPLNLPLNWLGLPPKRTQVLPVDSSKYPLASEFDYALLGPIELGPGRFEEVAFFHRRSRTLLVTDSLISVPENPPAIIQLDPYPLLFHARENGLEVIEDSQANRRQGWQRICLFALYFRPSVLQIIGWGKVFLDVLKAPDRSQKAYFGLFPFQWQYDWQKSFQALRSDRLLVAPILQTLILNRSPQETLNWVNKVMSWDFQRIIPCHFDSPVEADSSQLRQAFAFLEKKPFLAKDLIGIASNSLPEKDFEFLKRLDNNLTKRGIVPPAAE